MYVETPISVRYGETDMMGVVYHANYLLYFEDARIDFLNHVNFCYSERIEGQGYMSPIYEVQIKYHAPLRYGECGFVRTSIAKNQPIKTVYHQEVYKEGMTPGKDAPLVDAYVTVCVVERETFKPVNMKKTFPDLYNTYASVLESSESV
ncbi:thioesterase family protein [Eggerthellaceae bacterium 3-80]|nr:acyl-CoA thioesterase [bacterium D16-34]